MSANGSLIVVGTGIQWAGQSTPAVQGAIQEADRVLFAVADPWTARWVRSLKPSAESLPYASGHTPRREIYAEMVRRILEPVRQGLRVCAVFYGHPGVLTTAAHEVIARARSEGLLALMLPGVSFLDCLFADLGVDPGRDGLLVFEATDFLIRRRTFDPHVPLVLCQVGLIGNLGFFDAADRGRIRHGLTVLAEELGRHLPPEHEVVIYEAASMPMEPPRAERVMLRGLAEAQVTDVSSLYVPPLASAPEDPHMLARLEMNSGRIVEPGGSTASAVER